MFYYKERSKIQWALRSVSELCQTSKMELVAKIVNGWKTLMLIAKCPIFSVWEDAEYVSVIKKSLGKNLTITVCKF